MESNGGRLGTVRVLVVLIALLLPAGAYAATTVDPGQATREAGRVGAAGLSGELLADDQPAVPPTGAVTSTVAPATTVTVPASAPTTPARASTPAQAATTTTTVPRRTSTTAPAMFPTPPGYPPLPMPAFPSTAPANRWSTSGDGITLRMHIEPSMPVAGQPVTFVIDEVTAPAACCIIHLLPESGTPTVPFLGSHGPNPEIGICGSPPATRSGLSHTHTYAEPGVYAVGLMVITSTCQMPAVGGPSVPPTNRLLHLLACITVGPETVARSLPIPATCAGP